MPDAGCPSPAEETAAEEWAGQHQWQRLERDGFVLGDLDVEVRDVYVGSDLPWYGRVANELHASTEPAAIRALLSIEPGEAVEAERIYEAERRLRGQSFLTAARIVPRDCSDEQVDAVVRVRDAWTLQFSADVTSAGGETGTGVGISDDNFLGSGKEFSIGVDSNDDRTTGAVGYSDPAVFGSRWTLDLEHRRASDGGGDAITIARPFQRTDQPWSLRFSVDNNRGDLNFDQAGDTAFTSDYKSERARLEWQYLVASTPRGGWRAGVGWRRDHAAFGDLEAEEPQLRRPPTLFNRRLDGPYVVVERFRDRYRGFRNVRQVGRTEDFRMGLDTRLVAGRFRDSVDDDEPWFIRANFDYGLELGERNLLMAGAAMSGRYPPGEDEWQAQSLGVQGDYYHRTGPRNTIVTHAEFDWRDNADPEDEVYLGGFDGLFAYPDRFRGGDRRWRLHVEDRYTSDVIVLDTIQIGYSAFVEAGGVYGFDGEWGKTLADIGGGLRLGSLRSSFGTVTYVAVAFPLVDDDEVDDFELLIGSTVQF